MANGSSKGLVNVFNPKTNEIAGTFYKGDVRIPDAMPVASSLSNLIKQPFEMKKQEQAPIEAPKIAKSKPVQQPALKQINDYPKQQEPSLQDKVFSKAQTLKGMQEVQNKGVLQEFFKKAGGMSVDPKKTAWCAAFANSVLKANGLQGTGSLMAKSFLKWGKPTSTPRKGDVVVLHRGKDRRFGHVGFYAGHDKNGNILVLGGNQDNRVSIKSYPASRLAGYRSAP